MKAFSSLEIVPNSSCLISEWRHEGLLQGQFHQRVEECRLCPCPRPLRRTHRNLQERTSKLNDNNDRGENETEWPESWNTGSRAKFAKLIHNTLFWYFSVLDWHTYFPIHGATVWIAFIFSSFAFILKRTSAVNFPIVMEYFSTDFQNLHLKAFLAGALSCHVRQYFVVCRF